MRPKKTGQDNRKSVAPANQERDRVHQIMDMIANAGQSDGKPDFEWSVKTLQLTCPAEDASPVLDIRPEDIHFD